MSLQGPAPLQEPDVAHVPPHGNTEQRLEQGLCQIRRVLFPSKTEPEDKPMPMDDISLDDESVSIPNNLTNDLANHHRTGTCAFTMNTRMDVNILEHHPVQIT